ncbi:MAG TPA: hypothetical protein VHO24_17570 [Opitutaceae bacterium]|nr:hypothetical protein [Opitutaceae bacterium]
MKSPKNFAILLLALAAIGVATVAWNQYQELIELRAGALNNDERAKLQKALWDAEKRAKDLAEQLAAQRTRSPGESGDEGETASDGSPEGQNRRGRRGPGGGPGNVVNNMMTFMEQPEMQRLMAIQQKGQLDSRYAALFKNLKLSPEQLDKFKSLLVEKQTALQDVLAAARTQGINLRDDRDGFQKMVADTQAEVDNSIKATLGEEGFAKYQNYQETIPQRSVVNQLQQSLSYTGSPLSDAQADQLVQILAQTAPKNAGGRNNPVMNETVSFAVAAPIGGGGRNGGGGGGGPAVNFSIGGFAGGMAGGGASTPITDEAITLSQGVLSASQVQGLQQLQQQQQAQQQLQQAIRQNMDPRGGSGNGGRNSGGTGGTTTVTQPAKKG